MAVILYNTALTVAGLMFVCVCVCVLDSIEFSLQNWVCVGGKEWHFHLA